MKPWVHLGVAPVPGDAGELRLMRRDAEFSIRLGHTELMNSRLRGSEEALATLAFARTPGAEAGRILIGGLGMGFTLRAALAALGPRAHIDVVELVPAVVAWARGPMATLFGDSLSDPRVQIHEADVAAVIGAARQVYDAILLDVDNGPEGLTRSANDGLYDVAGLGAAMAALRPGGVLAVWSSAPDAAFTQRLRRVGFAVTEERPRANGKTGRGARHVIWLAVRPA
ncbi:spermine/spermidine synthase domain-containing protein [Alsobacter sp. SYSU BS001988]|jgi:spermidine synthase